MSLDSFAGCVDGNLHDKSISVDNLPRLGYDLKLDTSPDAEQTARTLRNGLKSHYACVLHGVALANGHDHRDASLRRIFGSLVLRRCPALGNGQERVSCSRFYALAECSPSIIKTTLRQVHEASCKSA